MNINIYVSARTYPPTQTQERAVSVSRVIRYLEGQYAQPSDEERGVLGLVQLGGCCVDVCGCVSACVCVCVCVCIRRVRVSAAASGGVEVWRGDGRGT